MADGSRSDGGASATSAQAPGPHYDRVRAAIGDRYRIEAPIGEGGMASVYLAMDVRHGRKVAVKVLHETLTHTIGIRRFLQEIDVIARLQHPHLLTLIDSGDVGGLPYYVMPYLEAQSLRELLTAEKRLPIERAVTIAREVADGLAYAHQNGIIHRDIKPSNILMSGGHAVVADFGIATALQNAAVGRLTETGISIGSPTYMSPEQAAGERDLDARTDVYSLGCVLYEMLSGEPPLDQMPMQQIVRRKLTGEIAPLRSRRADVPLALAAAVDKALATERDDRFATIAEFSAAIAAAAQVEPRVSRRAIWLGAAATIVLLVGTGAWLRHERRVVWATQQVGEIDRLASGGEYAGAFELASAVLPIIPRDSVLRRIRPNFTDFVDIRTDPPGARVLMQRLDRPDAEWEVVGVTPVDSLAMPKYGLDLSFRLRIEREGYARAEVLPNVFAGWAAWRGVRPLDTLRLDPLDRADTTMVRIPGWRMRDTLHGGGADSITFADYHIGKYEVTNREYQRFVAAGGYQNRDYWREPFIRDGKELTWEQAMAEFRDRSGLPGPATWSGGTYPTGQADHPVGGVSYHEAAAYARFAGKRLPTSTHWFRAALRHARETAWIYTPAANLNTTHPRPVGQGVMNSYGMYDVSGNVREWCVNPVDQGRLTRGGAWEDSEFHTGHLIWKSDFDRSPSNGFRVMSVTDHDTTLAHISGPVYRPVMRDFSTASRITDREFAIYRRLFAYDRLPLAARTEASGEHPAFRWEKVSFTAGYGGERMLAYIKLPRTARPPYEPIIFWPGSGAMTARRFDVEFRDELLSFLPASGRAIVYPLFKGAWERDDSTFSTTISVPDSTSRFRDLAIQWIKDLRRTVDYLETRDDIRADRIGFYGLSWGGQIAPLPLVLEPRLKAAVLYVGGYWPFNVPYPEVDPWNYVPRVTTPVLMINGRHDVVFPYTTHQVPFFEQLGTPVPHKRHVLFPTGHSVPQQQMVRETLDWFDRYLSGKSP